MARFYTAARRFPQLIGRTPDGTKLPFGPYTVVQMAVGGVALVVLWNTTGLWARFGLIANIVVAISLLFAAVWSAGRLPPGLRNPLVIVGGWLKAAERSLGSGRAVALVRLPKPRVAGGQVHMFTDPHPASYEDVADPDPSDEQVDDAPPDAAELAGAAAAARITGQSRPVEATLAPLTGAQRPLRTPVQHDHLAEATPLTGVQLLLAQSTTPR